MRATDQGDDVARERRHDEDRNWIAAIAAGGASSQAALAALFDRHHVRLQNDLRFHGVAGSDIDDAMQAAWLAIVSKAHTFSPTEIPQAWLRGIVRIERLRLLRRGGVQAARFVHVDDDTAEDFPDPAPTPEAALGLRQLRKCVTLALEALKRRRSAATWWVYLRHAEDWDLAEIARHRGGTEHAAVQFLSEARKQIRPFLAHCRKLLPNRR